MSWHCLIDPERGPVRLRPAPAAPVGRGTLMLELDLDIWSRMPGALIRLHRQQAPQQIFSIEPSFDGRLHLLRRHGAEVSQMSVGLGREATAGTLRLAYHWDHARRISTLTAENLAQGTMRQQDDRSALPLAPDEVAALFSAPSACQRHPALGWLAFADHWQTVGPVPGLGAEAPVSTPNGPRPLSTLKPGDLVMTCDDGPLPVRWQGRVTLPALGQLRPVRLLAPRFRLRRDLVVQPTQRIAISGADVEYHFGEVEVLVEARHLVDGDSAEWADAGALTRAHGLVLDQHALINVGGFWTESMYLGRIARNRDLARSTAPGALADGNAMPEHHAEVRRELSPAEVEELIAARRRRGVPLAA